MSCVHVWGVGLLCVCVCACVCACVCGQHCAGRWGAGQGAPEEVELSRAGLQIPQGKSVLLQEGEAGLGSKLKFYKLPRLMYGTAESWALTEAQGAQLETFHNGCLGQMMGLHRGPDGPSTAELLARTGQANRADQCFILFSSFPLLLAFVVGGLGFEFCMFVAGWRHALRSEWPFIIIIIMCVCVCPGHPCQSQLWRTWVMGEDGSIFYMTYGLEPGLEPSLDLGTWFLPPGPKHLVSPRPHS